MKKIIRKVVLILMAAAMMNFTACIRELDLNNAREVEKLLEEKYGMEFEVKSIGNRLASDGADTVTAYCSPKNNDKVQFTAKMHVSKTLVSDDYPVSLLEYQAKEIMEDLYEKNGITATVTVSVGKLADWNETGEVDVKQVIEEHPEMALSFITAVNETAEPKGLYDAAVTILKEFYSGNPKMLLGTTIWKMKEEDYISCAEEMNRRPNISKTFFEMKGALASVNVAMTEGGISKDYEEFLRIYTN